MILRMAHILNGGSLFKYYQRLEHDFISPTNLAFLLGCLRIHSYSNEEWYLENLSSLSGDASYSQYSSEENNEMSQARSALLSEFPENCLSFLRSLIPLQRFDFLYYESSNNFKIHCFVRMCVYICWILLFQPFSQQLKCGLI